MYARLFEEFAISPPKGENSSEPGILSSFRKPPETALSTDAELENDLETFVKLVKSPIYLHSVKAFKEHAPLAAVLCVLLKRTAQPLASVKRSFESANNRNLVEI